MNCTIMRHRSSRMAIAALLLLVTGSLIACDALDVTDPTALRESDLEDAAGAQMLRASALKALSKVMPGHVQLSGLFADEFVAVLSSSTNPATSVFDALDRRDSERYERLTEGIYGGWQELRLASSVALPKLRAHPLPGAGQAHVGEMYAVRGFGVLRMAEFYCPGFPLHNAAEFKFVPGAPHSTEEALMAALADFDLAIIAGADSARILQFAQLLRARTLLNLGRFADAAATAADVPTGYRYSAEFNLNADLPNFLTTLGRFSASVTNREGGNGLDFVGANDPRIPLISYGIGADRVTPMYGLAWWPTNAWNSPVILLRGVEARLIEAEAALHAGRLEWLTILNTLRTNGTQNDSGTYNPGTGGVAGLAPLNDPGTDRARIDLLYSERAFWLFATGSRLGDVRRLIARYSRSPENVFPTGGHRSGGVYGTATSVPFPGQREHEFNSDVTGCTSR